MFFEERLSEPNWRNQNPPDREPNRHPSCAPQVAETDNPHSRCASVGTNNWNISFLPCQFATVQQRKASSCVLSQHPIAFSTQQCMSVIETTSRRYVAVHSGILLHCVHQALVVCVKSTSPDTENHDKNGYAKLYDDKNLFMTNVDNSGTTYTDKHKNTEYNVRDE